MRSRLDLGGTAVEVTEFDGTDLGAVRDLVALGELVLLRTEIPGASRLDQWPRDVAESIGECALVPLSCLTGAELRRYPLLAGPPEQVRFLCSYADPVPAQPFPYRSMPVVSDYREFRDLWVTDRLVSPNPFLFQIGQRMAQLHSRSVLHGDAHLGNWHASRDGIVVIADPDPVFLHCPPSPEQCATDIRPLLADIGPDDWQSFRHGYRTEWPAEGRVIDLIQLTDRTGWAARFRAREYGRAVELLGRQLDGDDQPVVRVMLLANRALARSRTGAHGDALRDCVDAMTLARTHCPHVTNGLGITQAIVLAGQGARADAIQVLRLVSDQPERLLGRFEDPDVQLPIMNM